jgi:sporulation protein YlmC with PRC-barrel domain
MKRIVTAAVITSVFGFALATDGLAQARPEQQAPGMQQERLQREAPADRPTQPEAPPAAAPAEREPARDRDEARETEQRWTPDAGKIQSQKLVGTNVKDAEGNNLGSVKNLIVDQEEGQITHVVIGVGGFLGIGERERVVEWDQLNIRMDERNRLVATLDQGTLRAAPLFEEREAPAAAPALGDRPGTQPGAKPGTPRY